MISIPPVSTLPPIHYINPQAYANTSTKLFGQEILGVLVGLVWGLGIGFAITAAGTLIGEILIFL